MIIIMIMTPIWIIRVTTVDELSMDRESVIKRSKADCKLSSLLVVFKVPEFLILLVQKFRIVKILVCLAKC